MKYQILIISFFLSMSFIMHSQSWETVGPSNFSDGNADNISISVGEGQPYVVYKDAVNGNRASCKMFNGSSWENVGALGFSDGEVDDTYIYSESEYKAFVVYKDYANAGKITAKYIFNSGPGSYWQTIRNDGFSEGEAEQPSFSPYYTNMTNWCVVYKDVANGGKITVMTYYWEDPNSNWYAVGNAGFSEGEVDYPSIATNEDKMYVAYKDYAHGGKITVKKENSSWETVGVSGFSDGVADFTKIALDIDDVPYVAYKDMAQSGKATVKRFNGASWETVGVEGFSDGVADDINLKINDENTLYVSYKDIAHAGKPTLKKYDGNSWVTIGVEGFSSNASSFVSLSFDSCTPFIAYKDNLTGKVNAKKFDNKDWSYVGYGVENPGGPIGVSFNGVSPNAFTIDPFNSATPYICYASFNSDVIVKRFNGTDWKIVGEVNFTPSIASDMAISVNSEIPYVVFKDGDENIGTIMKYESTNGNGSGSKSTESSAWTIVGSAVLPSHYTPASSTVSHFYFSDTTPFFIYLEPTSSHKLSVAKFSQGSWVPVGTSGFSNGYALNARMSFPYIAYRDLSIDGKIVVKKYDGNLWETVGVEGFSEYPVEWSASISITSDSNTPYVAFQDSENGDDLSVMKFNGSSWEYVGIPHFSEFHPPSGTSIYKSPLNDDVYVLFANNVGIESSIFSDQKKEINTTYYKATVMKYDISTNTWNIFGSENFSNGGIMFDQNFAITASPFNNTDRIFVAFGEVYCPGACFNRAVVMQYSCVNDEFTTKKERKENSNRNNKSLSVSSNSLEDLVLYPNPVRNVLNIVSKEPIGLIALYNTLGEEVKRLSPNEVQLKIDMNDIQDGLYFVKISISNEIKTFTIIKK